jgi:2-dehydropantoate 2-reductase
MTTIRGISGNSLQNICIAGVGAVGTVIAYHLAKTFPNVSVVARGDTLQKVRQNGLTVISPEGDGSVDVRASDSSDLPVQDLIFLCAKAQDLPTLAKSVQRLLHPNTLVIPVVNGVPFCFFHGIPIWFNSAGAVTPNPTVHSVDPDGDLAAIFPARDIVGASVMIIAEKAEAGVSHISTAPVMTVGNIVTDQGDQAKIVADILSESGIATTVSPSIRTPVWKKLCANLACNGLSVIAECTLREICNDQHLFEISDAIFAECVRLGTSFEIRDLDRPSLMEIIGQAGDHKTSMLQDYQAGRPLEMDAICTAVIELARIAEQSVPLTQQMTRLVKHKVLARNSAAIQTQPIH